MRIEPLAHRGDAARIDAVNATRSGSLFGYEPGFFEHPQMLRDGGAADRQATGQVADRRSFFCHPLEDRPAGWIAEGGQAVESARCVSHGLP